MTDVYCAFSGGIDSTALALTFPQAIPVFTDTGDEFDHVYEHIDKFERITGRAIVRIKAPETLPEYEVRMKFLPNHGARFCTRLFKIEPMNRWLLGEDKPETSWRQAAPLIYGQASWLSRPDDEWDQTVIARCQTAADEVNRDRTRLPAELWIGLRADEPADVRVGNLTDMEGLTIKYPLRDAGFDRSMCIRVCLANDLLPRNPPYAVRGGCKGCFYKRKSEVMAMIQLQPDVIEELQKREEAVQDERGKFFHMFPNAGMNIADMKAQQVLFSMDDLYADAGDKSDMGQSCGLFCNR